MDHLLLFTMWAVVLVTMVVVVQGEVYYGVLVDSFKDSDGDGLGDLKGLIKQLSYIRAVGADAIILSPVSAMSGDCASPGVIDLTGIDQRYGDLETFMNLLEKAKKLELKVLVTLPLRTISVGSEWFNSSAGNVPGFEDWVLWKDETVDEPPSEEENIKWVFHEARNAYYGTINGEPAVNFCSEALTAALTTAQCSWYRRGVAGVLLDPDFPVDEKCGVKLLRKMAAEATRCARSVNLDMPIILVESSLRPESAARYYADGSVGATSVVSRALIAPRRTAAEMALDFYAAMLNAPDDKKPTWRTSFLGEARVSSRFGSDMIDAVNLLAMILPGDVILQQGDELGTADTMLEWATSDKCWPAQMVASAAPLPWDDTLNGGFTTGEPWMPLAPNYRYANAKTEYTSNFSHFGVLRVASAMRSSPAMGPQFEMRRFGGAISILKWGGPGSLLVVCNLAKDQSEVQLSKIVGIPPQMTVAASSTGSAFTLGGHIPTDKTLKFSPGEAVMLAGPPRHCGGPGPVDKIANKLNEGWQKLNKYFGSK